MVNPEENQDISLAIIFEKLKHIEDFIKSADKKYASKLAEKLIYGLTGIILIAVITALTSLVVKAIDYIKINI